MFAAPFDYFRAGSIDEAHQLLRQHPGAKLLAGGHSLIPLLKMRLTDPAALVDIGRIKELKGITARTRHPDRALTTHAEVAASELLKKSCPMLAEAAAQIGDPRVRNCGTVGGNVAHADPASIADGLTHPKARFTTPVEGIAHDCRRRLLQGMMTTALGDGDI
jgi:carbon-monoxide dehydrogenase medium subunit